MKGVIVKCLEDLVVTKFGKDKWEKSLEDIGLKNKPALFLVISDVPDEQVMKLIGAVCKNLGISLEQAADAFGQHWVHVYSQKLYSHYYEASKNAKEFLLNMDNVHSTLTKAMINAQPPRFRYEWKDDRTLIMHYMSHRGLIDFAVGLVKAVGEYYKENISVTKLGPAAVQVIFQ